MTPGPDLSAPIAQNIAGIVELQERELAGTGAAARRLETLSRHVARPGYLSALLGAVALWIAFNLAAPRLELPSFDPPPFAWLQGVISLIALLTATVVLVGQRRQTHLAEQRAHLDLQINLLTEQKVTKLIHLLEELRADLPGVRVRHDPHVSELKKPADPAQLASALKEREPGHESGPRQGEES